MNYLSDSADGTGIGVYVHVPFCLERCHFCAFYLQVYREDHAGDYLNALAREITIHAERGTIGHRQLDTLYLGGGTPTCLPTEDLVGILEHAKLKFGLQPNPEVCIEAHPDTVSVDSLRSLKAAGFNRLSLGVQSADEKQLIDIGRPSRTPLPRSAFDAARRAGFENVNIDLMYGLPGQTLESWSHTIRETLALEPTHVSCYAMTIEERTRLDLDVRAGVFPRPDPELQNVMEEIAAEELGAAGFRRYEISNYCRTGFECRHNLRYWRGQDYLGLGPSAQSFVGGRRFGNAEDLGTYCRSGAAGKLTFTDCEELSPEQMLREATVFGLRLIEGIDLAYLRPPIPDARDPFFSTLQRLKTQGLLEEHASRLRLTAQGRRYADSVAVELI